MLSAFQSNAFQGNAYQISGGGSVLEPNGNRRQEYQPTYYEMQQRREIERKFEEAQLSLKSTQIQIEEIEFKRLQDLADQAMQLELLRLLAMQNKLMLLLEQLQQQKLMALNDDNDFLMLLMCLN